MIQLLGSLAILAWVDWRLLIGALLAIPLVYATHRTWISKIRPQHRRRANRITVHAPRHRPRRQMRTDTRRFDLAEQQVLW